MDANLSACRPEQRRPSPSRALRRGTSSARGLAVLALTCTATSVRADGQSSVVVTAGDQTVTLERVALELARLGDAQLRALGTTPAAAALAFVEGTLVPRLLLAEDARTRLRRAPDAEVAILARATLFDVERSVPAVSSERIARYYDEHLHEFRHPRALKVWRILVKDAALARRIIAESSGAPGPEKWRLAAREHSLDDATKYRSGDLGFVYEDGRTMVPQVKVDPLVYRAASGVEDGQIVAEPVAMGDRFAVVWRRGTRPEVHTTLEAATAAIARALRHEDFARARDRLIADLRGEHLREHHPDLLDQVTLDSVTVAPAVPTNSAGAPVPTGSAAPVRTQRGLR